MDMSYNYAIELDDDYDEDDKTALDNLVASMPPENVNKDVLETMIIETAHKLGNILRIKPGIHHIVQIIQYGKYRIRVQINNEEWEPPSEIISPSVDYIEDMIYYYIA